MAGNNSKDGVMDVAKPGQAKPEIGSKPMIVGHRSIMTDPTLKPEDEDKKSIEVKSAKSRSAKKVVISPVSAEAESGNEEGSEEVLNVTEPAAEKEEKQEVPTDSPEPEKTEEQPETETQSEPDKETETPDNNEEADSDKQAAKEEQEAEAREARLREMIKSKEYRVPVKEHSSSSAATFMLSFLIVSLIGLAALIALIDAGILDLGLELPFDFIKR